MPPGAALLAASSRSAQPRIRRGFGRVLKAEMEFMSGFQALQYEETV